MDNMLSKLEQSLNKTVDKLKGKLQLFRLLTLPPAALPRVTP
jgi:hypothetical protein